MSKSGYKGETAVREALVAMCAAMRSGDHEAFRATIVPIGEGEEFRDALAGLAVERHALETAVRETFGTELSSSCQIYSGPTHDPAEAAAATVALDGDASTASLPDGVVYELIRTGERWLVDWPGKSITKDDDKESHEEYEILRTIARVLLEFRGRLAEPGLTADDFVRDLGMTMAQALSQAVSAAPPLPEE